MATIKRWLWFVLLAGLVLFPFGIGDFGGVNGGPVRPLASLLWFGGVLLFFFVYQKVAGGLGLTLHPGWGRNLALGMGYGLVTTLLAIWAKVGLGEFHLTALPWQQVLVSGLTVLVATAFIALSEEMVFRGYLVQLVAGRPKALVALVSAVGFVLLHLPHLGAPPQYWLSLLFKGLFYVTPVLATRSLWFGIGHHWLWNWGYFMTFGGMTGVTATRLPEYDPLSDYVYLIVSALMALSAPLFNRLLVRANP